MKRLLAPIVIATAALTLAACGSDGYSSSSAAAPAGSAGSPAAASAAVTAQVIQVDGHGSVLADANGRALYTSDEEAATPSVVCTGACESFWKPLVAGAAQPSAGPGVSDLGVAQRPDGTMQVTYQGRRLYTFTQDAPGQASGDGVSDAFGGQHFTWHVVVLDQTSTSGGTPAPAPTPAPASGYPGY
jgi:predicted lipoprotein with Yx(FWY)xxD motif